MTAPTPTARPISHVRIKQGINGAWHVRYRQDGKRNARRNFTTEAKALAWINKRRARHGSAPTVTANTELTVQGDETP